MPNGQSVSMLDKIGAAIRNPRKAIAFINYLVLKRVGKRDYKRFIVLSRSRTGSNMLISLLNSHPQVYAYGEMFEKLDARDYKKIFSTVFCKQPKHTEAVGFKIFYYHPKDDDSGKVWEELLNMRELYVIHLKRRNSLRTLVSAKIADKENLWIMKDDRSPRSASEKKVKFTVEELKDEFERWRKWERDYESVFKSHQTLDVYYEELVSDCEREFGRVTEFLGLRYFSPSTRLRKQNPERTSELVENYGELRRAFLGGEWAAFFED